jgi:hypothetical protein
VIHRDPGGRGLAGFRLDGRSLDQGQFEPAARSLASARAVAIVTGFCVPTDVGWTAETDGPPGALFLARSLAALGADVMLLSDDYGLPLLEAGCDFVGLPRSAIGCIPFEPGDVDAPDRASNDDGRSPATDAWIDAFLASGFGRRMTHLVAIERAGPSHTEESLAAQPRSGPAPRHDFERLVPPDSRNVCHTMRGVPITAHTSKAHRLFEVVRLRRPDVATIGIGDGGNELGMGSIAWETLVRAVAIGPAPRVICRIATQYLLVAGVSNWAGYALGLAAGRLRASADRPAAWTPADENRLVEHLVREAGAVDGVTRRNEPTVDGLPMEVHGQVLSDLTDLSTFLHP